MLNKMIRVIGGKIMGGVRTSTEAPAAQAARRAARKRQRQARKRQRQLAKARA